MSTRAVRIRNRHVKHQINELVVNVLAALVVMALIYLVIGTLYVLLG